MENSSSFEIKRSIETKGTEQEKLIITDTKDFGDYIEIFCDSESSTKALEKEMEKIGLEARKTDPTKTIKAVLNGVIFVWPEE